MIKNATTDRVYAFLRDIGCTHQGSSGMMGNLYSESWVCPYRAEELLCQRYDEDSKGSYWELKNVNGGFKRPVNTADNNEYNSRLYTERIMNGTIKKDEFISPRKYTGITHQYAYGLAQWTTRSRKLGLWERTMDKGIRIDDLEAQLDYLRYELENVFPTVFGYLKDPARSMVECSDIVLKKFEAPANADAMKGTRRTYSQYYYDAYINYKPDKKEDTGMDFTKYKGKISNSGSDERGSLRGGKAGDQTGTEWQIKDWYNRPWSHVIRYPDQKVRELIAELAIEAANNSLIGYDQDERYTFWQQLKVSGYRPKNITKACESDCSAGVAAIVKAAGYLLGNTKMQSVSSECYSGNIRAALKSAGFEVYTDSKYRTGTDYLVPGDILLYENHHVATNLGIGSKVNYNGNTPEPTPDSKADPEFSIKLKQVYKGCQDSASVRLLSEIFRARGYLNIDRTPQTVSKHFGDDLEATLKYYQKQRAKQGVYLGSGTGDKHVPDGICGEKTWRDLLG